MTQHVQPGTPHTNRTGTINHLRLTVSNIVTAKSFYAPLMQTLAYRLVEENETRLAWASWAPHGTLQWFILSASKPGGLATSHDRYSPGFHHLAWNVQSREEVDACYRALVEQNVSIIDPPAEYEYEPGYYAFFFSDPDGLKLEIVNVGTNGSLAYWGKLSGS